MSSHHTRPLVIGITGPVAAGRTTAATMFVTTFPCPLCANKITHCGINAVIFAEPYNFPEAFDVFREARTELSAFTGFTHNAFHRVFSRHGRDPNAEAS